MTYTPVFGGSVINPANVSYHAFTLSTNIDLGWASSGVDGENVVADLMDVTASAGSLYFTLPDATETGTGTSFIFFNVGATTFEVRGNGGASILNIASGEAWHFRLTDNSTAAGTWATVQFGMGTSSASASSLAGYGLTVLTGTLNLTHTIQGKNATYSVATSDRASTLLWTGGAGTFNLLTAASATTGFFFLCRNGGTGNLTIDPAGVETIDGASTATLAPGESCFILTDGTAWYTVGQGRSITNTITRLTLNLGALSSPYTETATQAANQIQEFTGALGAGFTIYMPTTVAIYYAYNNTTGSQTVTVQTVSGTGVTIAAGIHKILYCDGTNIDEAIDAGAGSVTDILTGTGLTGGPITTSGTIALSVPMQLANGAATAPTYGAATASGLGMYFTGSGLGFATSSLQRVHITTASGYVGVGTATPTSSIHTTEAVRANSGFYVDGTNFYNIVSAAPRQTFDTNDYVEYNRTSNTYTWYVGAAARMLVNASQVVAYDFLSVSGTGNILPQVKTATAAAAAWSYSQSGNETWQVGAGPGDGTVNFNIYSASAGNTGIRFSMTQSGSGTVFGSFLTTGFISTSGLYRFPDGTTQSTAAPRSKEFVSTNQNFTASTIISLAHLLGRQPIGVQAYAVAKAAAPGGYTSGTEVQIDYGDWSGNNTGISVVTDTTSVIVRIASNAGATLNLPHATTLAYTTLDIADFWLKVRAWTMS